MKAEIKALGASCPTLTLIPENADDGLILRQLSEKLSRAHMLTSRGFEYMKSEVSFLIQPWPSSD